MPKLKRLLISTFFENAQRRRCCSRNTGHIICKGEKCLVTKEGMAKKNYCMACAALILCKAKEDISSLENELVA